MRKWIIVLITLIATSCSQPKACGEIKFYVDIIKPEEEIQEQDLTLKDGEKYSGRCAKYFEDGTLSSIEQYKNGKDHGSWKFYFPNGNIETTAKFNNGERVGKWKYYYENGSLKQVSFYKRNLKNGIWKVYSEEGELISSQKWINGEVID